VPQLEPIVGDGTDSHALELYHRVPDGIEHLPDLPVASFVNHQRQNSLWP
jgi:hypothetical protein